MRTGLCGGGAGAVIRPKSPEGKKDMTMTQYALIMLAAGIGIPTLAALNAELGRIMGSPAAAASILFVVALIIAVVATILTGPQALARAAEAPRYLFLGGVLVAFYVLSITYIAPSFGVGNAVFFVLIGQLISAAAIDHFGLFGAQVSPLNLIRASGIALMGIGVWITQAA
jgi:bacterial/archaeal transporter family-2 protein